MTGNSFVSRINQIDAVELDNEIYKVLKNQFNEVAKYFSPGKIAKWDPELDILIKYLIWHYSLRKDHSTFGQRLLNLSYKNLNDRKVVLLFLFSTIPHYLQKRLINENFILSRLNRSNNKYLAYIEQLDNFIHVFNFIWTFYFLYSGNQPRFIEKLLGIYNQSLDRNKPRAIGYSYMARELLWHGLIELFTVGLPMIDFRRIQKLWNNLWLPKKTEKKTVSHCYLEASSVCSYCKEPPILPQWAGCPHVFCYYCLEALFMIMDPYQCPACGDELFSNNMKTVTNV